MSYEPKSDPNINVCSQPDVLEVCRRPLIAYSVEYRFADLHVHVCPAKDWHNFDRHSTPDILKVGRRTLIVHCVEHRNADTLLAPGYVQHDEALLPCNNTKHFRLA